MIENDKFQEAMLTQLSAAFTEIPFNHMLGLKLNHIDAQHVNMSFAMKKELIGNFMHGILHGGVISSVLDMAGGMMVMAAAIYKNASRSMEEIVDILAKCSTIDLQVSYINPGKGELFQAKAWLIKSGKNITFTRMELLNQEESLLATANGTYLLM